LQWKRAREIRPNFSIFGPTIVPTDIKQGGIGDCYVLAALASLAERPLRVHEMFYNAKNASGCYLIKFYVNGIPTGVMVDDLFLCNGSDLFFARCKGDEFWVALIEKAYAKLLGSYSRLPAGSAFKVMHTLTGAPSTNFDHHRFSNDENLKDAHWERLKSCDKKHMMMCLSSN
jgi:calpain-15